RRGGFGGDGHAARGLAVAVLVHGDEVGGVAGVVLQAGDGEAGSAAGGGLGAPGVAALAVVGAVAGGAGGGLPRERDGRGAARMVPVHALQLRRGGWALRRAGRQHEGVAAAGAVHGADAVVVRAAVLQAGEAHARLGWLERERLPHGAVGALLDAVVGDGV